MESPRLTLWRYRHGMLWWQRRAPRREFEARIYCGLPGSGKTLAMVRDAVDLMRSGVVVASNLAIHDPIAGDPDNPNAVIENGSAILRSRSVRDWLDVLTLAVEARREGYPIVFAIDEIHLLANAQDRRPFLDWVQSLFTQRRKLGMGIIGTTQDLEQVSKRVRVLVNRVVDVRALVPRFQSNIPLYRFRTVDLAAFDAGIETEAHWSLPKSMAWYAYEGYDTGRYMRMARFIDYQTPEIVAKVDGLLDELDEICNTQPTHPPVFVLAPLALDLP